MTISDSDSLQQLQAYVWQMNKDRGFHTNTPEQKLLLLMEEVGELAKAIRKTIGLGFSETTKVTEVADELADVQIILLGLASLLDVDMLEAVKQKEEKNKTRTWVRDHEA